MRSMVLFPIIAGMVELGVNDPMEGQGYLWNDKCTMAKFSPGCLDHAKEVFHLRWSHLEFFLGGSLGTTWVGGSK